MELVPRVERGDRLVGQKDRRFDGKRAGEKNARAFTARQDGREIWSFVTRVDQGTTPTLRSGPPELQTAKVRLEKDRLTIENLVLPISYTAPGAKASTRVEVDLEYEGEGARI